MKKLFSITLFYMLIQVSLYSQATLDYIVTDSLLTIKISGTAFSVLPDETTTQSYAKQINKIVFGPGITGIGQNVFAGFENLRTIEIPEMVGIIKKGAFKNCLKLQTVILPKTMAIIEDSAFYNCPSLQEVTLNRTIPPSIKAHAFDSLNVKTKLYVPFDEKSNYENTSGVWTHFEINALGQTSIKDFTNTDWYYLNIDKTTIPIKTSSEIFGLAELNNNGIDFTGITIQQANDIDLFDSFIELGCTWSPIGSYNYPFNGTYDGRNHSISNLMIETQISSEEAYVGLFGNCKMTSTIKNLILKGGYNGINASVNYIGSNASYIYIGGIAGQAGIISNCTSEINISVDGTKGMVNIGGIAGSVCSLYNSYNTGELSLGKTLFDQSQAYAGGLAGFISDYAQNCYSSGHIIQSQGIGLYNRVGSLFGITGFASSIKNCYGLLGAISNDSLIGLFRSTYKGSYYRFNSSSKISSNITIGSYTGNDLLTALNTWRSIQSKPSNYLDWDKGTVNNGFPTFTYQQYIINIPVYSIPLDAGNITGANASGLYKYNTILNLVETENAGYKFDHWTVDGTKINNSSSSYSFTTCYNGPVCVVYKPVENADKTISFDLETNSATIHWTAVDSAKRYAILIYQDKELTQLIDSVFYDNTGQMFKSASTNLKHTFSSLQLASTYYYNLTSYNSNNIALRSATGSFTTLSSTGISNAKNKNTKYEYYIKDNKVIINGVVLGETIAVYNPQGQSVYNQTAKAKTEEIVLPTRGVYVVRVGNESVKLVY